MKSQIETWKWIDGYEGFYKVSDCGSVKNATGKILKLKKEKNGYLRVHLDKKGKREYFNVHRLVAETFLPNPDNLPQVNHKDEAKTNNHLENLEWCTPSYNINYGTRNKKMVLKCSKPVKQYSLDGKFLKEWPSAAEIQRQTGFWFTAISQCCLGKRKSAYHFKWSF